jgi:hypothetical protein
MCPQIPKFCKHRTEMNGCSETHAHAHFYIWPPLVQRQTDRQTVCFFPVRLDLRTRNKTTTQTSQQTMSDCNSVARIRTNLTALCKTQKKHSISALKVFSSTYRQRQCGTYRQQHKTHQKSHLYSYLCSNEQCKTQHQQMHNY